MTDNHLFPLVVAVGGDPGGASALAPVIEVLRDGGRVRVEARAYRHAAAVWKKRGISFEPLDERSDATLSDDTQLVLTSTSLNGLDLEKRYIAAAQLRGIASVSVLDFWSNYRRRFSADNGSLDCLPDRIAVMDSRARDEMIAEGFAPRNLVITGQPAFDDLENWNSRFTSERRREVRLQLGVEPGGLLVVFASQPFSTLYGTDALLPDGLGFDEHSVAELLLRALEMIAAECGRHTTLVIRLHPREDVANFDYLRSSRVGIQVATIGNAREAIASADLVVGMNTVLLIEACYLGCVVVSMQPNLRGNDPLPTNRLGFSRAVYSEQDVFPTIRELLLDENSRRRVTENLGHFRVNGCAANRVADVVYSLLLRKNISMRS